MMHFIQLLLFEEIDGGIKMIKFQEVMKNMVVLVIFTCSVEYGDIVYPNSECAWQSLKTLVWRRERNLQHIRQLVPRKWEDGLSFVRTGKK